MNFYVFLCFLPRRSHNSSTLVWCVVLAQWLSSFCCITLAVFYNEYGFIQKSLCFLTLCLCNCTTGLITAETANENVKCSLIPWIANGQIGIHIRFQLDIPPFCNYLRVRIHFFFKCSPQFRMLEKQTQDISCLYVIYSTMFLSASWSWKKQIKYVRTIPEI